MVKVINKFVFFVFDLMIVSFVNMKGGVGKTTLTVNLAYALAKKHDKKVLVVDLDPQFNASQYLMKNDDYIKHIESREKCTTADILIEKNNLYSGVGDSYKITSPEPKITNSIFTIFSGKGKLDLIPSQLELMEAETLKRGVENRLKNFLKKFETKYDFILIDCPPTMGLFTLSAFIASDAYLTPVKPDYLSSVGLILIKRAFSRFNTDYPKEKDIKYLGTVFVMVEQVNIMKETMRDIEGQTEYQCFRNKISKAIRIAHRVKDQKLMLDFPKSKTKNEIIGITSEFLQRIKR